MDKKWAMKWAKALESGKYKQGRGRLKDEDGKYCCLGVLCEVSGVPKQEWVAGTSYMGCSFTLGPALQEMFGIRTESGLLPKPYRVGKSTVKSNSLVALNDRGVRFKRIARIIRENWEAL